MTSIENCLNMVLGEAVYGPYPSSIDHIRNYEELQQALLDEESMRFVPDQRKAQNREQENDD